MRHYKFEEEARQFSKDYNNIYYSWGWRDWVASRTAK